MADKPAKRMSFGVVTVILLSLLVFRLVFICCSPVFTNIDKFVALGTSVPLEMTVYSLQINLGDGFPTFGDFVWGTTHHIPC